MTRVGLSVMFVLGLSASAFADITIKQTTSGKGMGASVGGATTTYIKGMKMRTEMTMGDTVRTTIFDVDAQKMYIFDSKKKEADVWDMAEFGAEIAKNVQTGEMKASVKPNGQTKQIAGKSATGYDMEISVPASMGGEKGMKMTVMLTGPMWVVKGAPGTSEYIAFYKAAAEKGWIFSDPRAAKGSPGQAKAMTEMYRQLAATGGVPYETEMSIKMNADGPMAAMMAKMGGMSVTTTTESVDTATVAASMFAPPADYKLNQKK